ncbi:MULTISPECIES: Ig-like domain-containing protein, partial [Vagococcus]|uniref:Ig-like domain-containing protein n=1 Tax=Vagococcus TaxID=2737 RepID=UPI000FEDB5EA
MNDKQKKIVNFLNAKPQDKIHRYKRRKVKKVWVYAAIITTMIGLESISSNINILSGLSSITVHADTVVNYKQRYYPPILEVGSGSTAQEDGADSYLNLLYEIKGKEASDVDYIEFQLNNGPNSTKFNPKAKIIGGTNILGQSTVMLRVDFSGEEAFDNDKAFADGNTVIHFIDGTSLVINPNRNNIFFLSKGNVEDNRGDIMKLSNFTEEEKNKTFEKSISIVEKGYIDVMKSLSEVTDFDSLSLTDVNSLYKNTIEVKLEQASKDFTNQDLGFKQFEDEAKSKKAEINAVTDAKEGAKEKALKEVDSLLSQYRKSTFDATGEDVLSQITEGVAKIKAVSVEREDPFDKDAHKPTVNQPTEGEQVVSGKGIGGDEITIKDKDNNVIGKGTVAEDGTFTVKTDRPLEKGEELTVIPTTDGKEGTPGTTTVAEKPFDKDAHKPTINQPTEGEQVVSGKGIGGDEITIKDKDNNVIGKGTVAEDGT